MKGFLSNTEGWVVRYDVFQHDYSYTLPAWNFIALHPECIKYAEVGKVEFEIVKYDGKTSLSEGWGGYAKLIGSTKINTWDDIFDNIESKMDCVVPKWYKEQYKIMYLTPKQKAVQLVIQYDELLTYLESKAKAKECAIMVVNAIKEETADNYDTLHAMDRLFYWTEVISEIGQL